MPTLNNAGALVEDPWIVAQAPEQDQLEHALVPLERWQNQAGLYLNVADEPTAALTNAQVIAIDFPAFNDGRGLSLALLLRERFDYQGTLLAVGDVHPDMLHYMHRSGFDWYRLPEHRDLATAQAAMHPFTAYYQASLTEPTPVFRR